MNNRCLLCLWLSRDVLHMVIHRVDIGWLLLRLLLHHHVRHGHHRHHVVHHGVDSLLIGLIDRHHVHASSHHLCLWHSHVLLGTTIHPHIHIHHVLHHHVHRVGHELLHHLHNIVLLIVFVFSFTFFLFAQLFFRFEEHGIGLAVGEEHAGFISFFCGFDFV